MAQIKTNSFSILFFVLILGLVSCAEDSSVNTPEPQTKSAPDSDTLTDPGSQQSSPDQKQAWRIEAPSLHFEALLDLHSGEETLRLSDQEQLSQISRLTLNDYLMFGPDSETLKDVQLQVHSQCLSVQNSKRFEQRFDLNMSFSPQVFVYQILPTEVLHVNNLNYNPIHCGFQFVALNAKGSKHHFVLQTLPIALTDGNIESQIKMGREPLHLKALAGRIVHENQLHRVWIEAHHSQVTSLSLMCEIFSSDLPPIGPFLSRQLNEFQLYRQGASFNSSWQDPFLERPYQKCRAFGFGEDRLLSFSEVFEMRFNGPSWKLQAHEVPPVSSKPHHSELKNARPYFAYSFKNTSSVRMALRLPREINNLIEVTAYSIRPSTGLLASSSLKHSVSVPAQIQVHGLSRGRHTNFPEAQRVVLEPGGEFRVQLVATLPFTGCQFTHPKNLSNSSGQTRTGIQLTLQNSRLPQVNHVSTDWTPNSGRIFDRRPLPHYKGIYNFSFDSRNQPLSKAEPLNKATLTRTRCW